MSKYKVINLNELKSAFFYVLKLSKDFLNDVLSEGANSDCCK